MANWLPPQARGISCISCIGPALDGSIHLTIHSIQQIGERHTTVENLILPYWLWDKQAVQSTNQRMEGLEPAPTRSVSHIFVGTAPLVPLLVGSSERCSQSRA
jgi:hypothetical protein